MIWTLAHQLALFDGNMGSWISKIVEKHPNISCMPLEFQFTNLLAAQALGGLEWAGGPIVLIVDALDECGNDESRKFLLHALQKGFLDLPPFLHIIVVSRREPDIEDVLGSHPAVYSYPLDINSGSTKEDILHFLQHHLSEIPKAKKLLLLPPDWPGHDSVQILSEQAGGLFIWASTACLYIKNSHYPSSRLTELITQQSVNTSSGPFFKLDKLYKTGLESAGDWTDSEFKSSCCDILGMILCSRIPLSASAIDSILALPQPCLHIISYLGCVLQWSNSEDQPIRTLHPSFHDYLAGRSCDEPWFVDIATYHYKISLCCIKLLQKSLKQNICGLVLPNPVEEQTLSEQVAYACRFWVAHVCIISKEASYVGDCMYDFLCQHILHWIEGMAILKNHDNTIHSLQRLLEWVKVCFIMSYVFIGTHVQFYRKWYQITIIFTNLYMMDADLHNFLQILFRTIHC